MKAVRKLRSGVGQIELVDTDMPVANPGHVLLEVHAAGICGTDIHILLDEFPSEPPVTLGHEVAGTVVGIGDGVQDWQVGDRAVTETYYSFCGECEWCRVGRPNLCADRRSIGSKEDGGFAEYVEVPARNLHRLPDGMDWTTAALTEPLACVVHGVNRVGVRPGEWVVVSGPGPIGLLTMQVAMAAGGRVIAVGIDQDAKRLETARKLGAEVVLNVEQAGFRETIEHIHDLTGGGAQVVFECAGAGPSSAFVLEAVRKQGRYGQIGLYGKAIPVNMDTVCYKELTVTGTNASVPETWPQALDLLARGVIRSDVMVSAVYPLEKWDDAFKSVQEKGALKVMLTANPS